MRAETFENQFLPTDLQEITAIGRQVLAEFNMEGCNLPSNVEAEPHHLPGPKPKTLFLGELISIDNDFEARTDDPFDHPKKPHDPRIPKK